MVNEMTASQKAAALQVYQQTLLAAQLQSGQIPQEQVSSIIVIDKADPHCQGGSLQKEHVHLSSISLLQHSVKT